MNVASLELCKELYELSGWGEEVTGEIPHSWYRPDDWVVECGTGGKLYGIPAYDLGYLMRKLPPSTYIQKLGKAYTNVSRTEAYRAWNNNWKLRLLADTPEDAAAKLAIELFKQGVLTK